MNELTHYFSALMLGLIGSTHCIGMCGGITSALSLSIGNRSSRNTGLLMISYHCGRLFSYAFAGFLLGSLGWILAESHPVLYRVLRFVAGGLLVAMGLYLSGWWRGLTHLEQAGHLLWKKIQPVSRRLLPIRNVSSALLLGAMWGWLPCGLVYSSLLWSASQGSPLQSAWLMLCFGAGTLPTLILTGVFSRHFTRLLQAQTTRNIMAVLVIGFGLWTLLGPYLMMIMMHPETTHH